MQRVHYVLGKGEARAAAMGGGVPRRAREKWFHFSNCATFGKVAKPQFPA